MTREEGDKPLEDGVMGRDALVADPSQPFPDDQRTDHKQHERLNTLKQAKTMQTQTNQMLFTNSNINMFPSNPPVLPAVIEAPPPIPIHNPPVTELDLLYAILQQQQAMTALINTLVQRKYHHAATQPDRNIVRNIEFMKVKGVIQDVICNFCKRKGHQEMQCYKKNNQCFVCGSLRHKIKDCHQLGSCRFCRRMGHIEKYCYWKNGQCFYCGMSTHKIKECPEFRHNKNINNGDSKTKPKFKEKGTENEIRELGCTNGGRNPSVVDCTKLKVPVRELDPQHNLVISENRGKNRSENVSLDLIKEIHTEENEISKTKELDTEIGNDLSLVEEQPLEETRKANKTKEIVTEIKGVLLCMYCGKKNHRTEDCREYIELLKLQNHQVNLAGSDNNNEKENKKIDLRVVNRPPSVEAEKETRIKEKTECPWQKRPWCASCEIYHSQKENCQEVVQELRRKGWLK